MRVTETAAAPSPKTAARIAGSSYLALFALGIFANFFVRERLVAADDPAATFRNIAESSTLVRVAIVAFIVAFVLDVLVAWALYHVFAPAGASTSMLAAAFRIVYTVFLGVAIVFLFAALELVADGSPAAGLGGSARVAHTTLAVRAFDVTWLIGLTCFGVHLALLGVMILRSDLAPRGLGVILLVAGGAYVFDTVAYSLLATYHQHRAVFSTIVAVPAVAAEGVFTFWLLRRAGRVEGTRPKDNATLVPV